MRKKLQGWAEAWVAWIIERSKRRLHQERSLNFSEHIIFRKENLKLSMIQVRLEIGMVTILNGNFLPSHKGKHRCNHKQIFEE